MKTDHNKWAVAFSLFPQNIWCFWQSKVEANLAGEGVRKLLLKSNNAKQRYIINLNLRFRHLFRIKAIYLSFGKEIHLKLKIICLQASE